MIFGYHYPLDSKEERQLYVQALQAAGCEQVIVERTNYSIRGRNKRLSGLKGGSAFQELLTKLRKGDVLVVYDLVYLGRTAKQLLDLIVKLRDMEIHFKSLSNTIFDTTTPEGKVLLAAATLMKEAEQVTRGKVIKAGIKTARPRGRNGGRPAGSYDKVKAAAAATLYRQGVPIVDITKKLSIARSTLYKYIRLEGIAISSKKHK